MDIRYQITGGVPLQGEVTIGGSKNAALPMIAGSVLVSGETVLTNVPRLRDTEIMLSILEFLGAETSFHEGTVRIRTDKLQSKPIPENLVSKLRGAIVLLGPLLARFGVVEMSYPGGCVLGKRPVEAHVLALEQMGAQNMSTPEVLHLQGALKASHIILPEFSVTATENAIWAAALTEGETIVDIAAAEPHVQECARMAAAMGAQIEGIGTHQLKIRGTKSLQPVAHRVPFDYLEAGCFVIAALVTRGKLRLRDVDDSHLTMFLDVIRRAGGIWKYTPEDRTLFVDGELSFLNALKLQTNIFPGFPTDLQAPMGVLMTQAKGVSRVFETLFEGRLAYLYELEKMGAQVEILNSHEALIIGPTPLKGRLVASNDIRAGAAMVLAGLCAEGKTTITDVKYIERGYEHLDEKLRSVGAKIERQIIETVPAAS
jgi:UDP-N-acetylglucosamine 1-carboxyvinyltransferase